MALPRFTAELTLYKSTRHYSTIVPHTTVSVSQYIGQALHPAYSLCRPPNKCCGGSVGPICGGECCTPLEECCPDFNTCCPAGACCGPEPFTGRYSCCYPSLCVCSAGHCACAGGGGGDIGYGGGDIGGYGGGYGGGDIGGCFVQGTLVSTGAGFLPIEEIEVGTEVLAYDLDKSEIKRRKVTRVYRGESDSVIVLDFGYEQVSCTPRHQFFTGDWTTAKNLHPGDTVLCRDGNSLRLQSMKVDHGRQRIFNFSVQENRNYFVGSAGLLVHNIKAGDGDYCAQNPEDWICQDPGLGL